MGLNLSRWTKGDITTAAKLNEPVDAINENLPIVGGPGITTSTLGDGGTTVSVTRRVRGRNTPLAGKIVTAGPDGEADWTDHRYWVRLELNDTTEDNYDRDGILDMQEVEADNDNEVEKQHIVLAYNLAEYTSNAHAIPAGAKVLIQLVEADNPTEEDIPPQPRYFILGGSGETGFWAKIGLSALISGAQNRWSYAWTEQRLVQFGAFEDRPSGMTSANTGMAAFNSVETNNDGTSTEGNSVNVSNLPTGFALKPVQGSPVVWVRLVRNCASEEESGEQSDYYELIFQYVNQVDGVCTAGDSSSS